MKVQKLFLRWRVVVFALAVALFVSACAGSEATSVATAGSSAAGASSDDGPQSFDDIEMVSPIGDFLGFDFSDTDGMDAQFAEMEREAGRLTAACMAEKGFEYIPRDTSDFMSFSSGDDLPYFSDEWVEKYGFGITTQRFPQSSVGDLVGYPDEEFMGPDEDFVDPNEEYLNGLTDGEREAYQEALWGLPPDFDEAEGPDADFVYEPSGCEGEAFEQAFQQGPGGNFEAFFDEFGDELEAMEQRAMSHPDVAAFNSEVSSCVSDAGMVWVDMESLYEQFEPRLSELQPGFGPGAGDPFEAAGVDPEEMSEREMDEFFRDLQRLPADKLDELAALQAEELALAKVVVGCGGGPLNEQVVLGDVRVELEQEFLDQNADALADFDTGN